MNRDRSYLRDIDRCCREILDFTRDISRAEFSRDRQVQAAVMYDITVIGEAVKKLSPALRQRHPEIPWRQIAGMRDKLIHDYRQIDANRVWESARTDIPNLLARTGELLRDTDTLDPGDPPPPPA